MGTLGILCCFLFRRPGGFPSLLMDRQFPASSTLDQIGEHSVPNSVEGESVVSSDTAERELCDWTSSSDGWCFLPKCMGLSQGSGKMTLESGHSPPSCAVSMGFLHDPLLLRYSHRSHSPTCAFFSGSSHHRKGDLHSLWSPPLNS